MFCLLGPRLRHDRLSVALTTTAMTSFGTMRVISQLDLAAELTAQRWTRKEPATARHAVELVPGALVHLNLDIAKNGLGTESCGPGVLPQYRLHAHPALRLVFRPVTI